MLKVPTGPVTGWVSGTGLLHLDLKCDGLAFLRTRDVDPAETFTPLCLPLTEYASLPSPVKSVCRICAAGPVVVAALRAHRRRARTVFVTFTLQRPTGQASGIRRSKDWHDETAQDRMDRIREQTTAGLAAAAKAGGLSVTNSITRPAAYGFVATATVPVLERLVRTEVRYTVHQLPPEELVSTFWSLQSKAGPDGPDPWFLAELIFAAPAA